jgi:hypothetical protein
MKKPATLDRQLAKLKISELQSLQHVETMQRKMLRLLKQSQVDPISYVGLEYCGPNRCGRVDCSEACWFGRVRRRATADKELGQLLGKHKGKFYKVVIDRSKWNREYGELHEINITSGKSIVARILDGYNDRGIVAVGTFKVRPFGYNNHGTWRCEIEMIVAGTFDEIDLKRRFRPKRCRIAHEVMVDRIKRIDAAINDVMSCNEPAEPIDKNYDGQRQEFYNWLANMKVGSRLIRYGCDEAFKALP